MSLNYTLRCINASAGSGKTTHIVNQILAEAAKTQSFEYILCLTFSNAAAQELMNRIFKQNMKLPKPYKWNNNLASTLHAFCLTLLRYYNPHYQILTSHMQQLLWTKSLNTCADKLSHLSYKHMRELAKYAPISHVPEELHEIYQLVHNTFTQYKTYESLISFDEIISHTQNLLIKDMLNDGLHGSLSNIKYLYIDESQDLSNTQWEIINSLINEIIQINHLDIVLVGDKMQSIYSFQGANPRSYEIFQEVHHDIHLMHQSEGYHKQSMSHSYRYGANVTKLVNTIFDLHQTTLSKAKDSIEMWEPSDDWQDRICDTIVRLLQNNTKAHATELQPDISQSEQHIDDMNANTMQSEKRMTADILDMNKEAHGQIHTDIQNKSDANDLDNDLDAKQYIFNTNSYSVWQSEQHNMHANTQQKFNISKSLDIQSNQHNTSMNIQPKQTLCSDIIILIRKRNKKYLQLAQKLRSFGIPVSYDENTDICKTILSILVYILDTTALHADHTSNNINQQSNIVTNMQKNPSEQNIIENMNQIGKLNCNLTQTQDSNMQSAQLEEICNIDHPINASISTTITDENSDTTHHHADSQSLDTNLHTYYSSDESHLSQQHQDIVQTQTNTDEDANSNHSTHQTQAYEQISQLLSHEQILELYSLTNTPIALMQSLLTYLHLSHKRQHAILLSLTNFLISNGNNLYSCKLFFEGNPHFEAVADSSVRIQTIHSTKGMEADVIFLCDTMQNPNFDTVSPNISKDTALEEYKRLLYVALTRTKQHLIIVNNPETYKLSSDSWYSMIKSGMIKSELFTES